MENNEHNNHYTWFYRVIVLAAIVFIACLALPKKCTNRGHKEYADSSVQTSKTIKWDTFYGKPVLISGALVQVHDTAWQLQPVDTAAILASYFTRNIYSRNWADTICTIAQIDTVYKNKLYPGPVYTTYRRATITQTITKTYTQLKEPQFSINAGAFSVNNAIGFTLGGGYYKHGWGYTGAAMLGKQTGILFSISKTLTNNKLHNDYQ